MVNKKDIPDGIEVMASAVDSKQVDIHWIDGGARIEFEFETASCPSEVWTYLSMLYDSMEFVRGGRK